MHRGTDFAAPSGTPIYAAGKGKVEKAGRNGGYGRYVRIRHNSTYKTAYAHMKAIAKGVKRGTSVRQGQVIGYVGSTGRSTGPHLHYEVILNGKQTNPLKLRLPSGDKLKGEQLARFEKLREEVDRLRGLPPKPLLVEAD
jgi:murein DD-endopeptidase MepM/ murein hydrolase activator NlpD